MTVTLSCIIPAYNESGRIGRVLEVATRHPRIDEVVVVDDGSTDCTRSTVTRFNDVLYLQLGQNGGKTAALAAGIEAARGDVLLLIDADLEGLRADDLSALIDPVLDGRADMSISLRGNAPSLWRWIGLDYISGERVLHRRLVEASIPRLRALPRFGFEVFLNDLAIWQSVRLAVVRWPSVRSELKVRKHGFWKGLRGDFGMIADVLRTCGVSRPVTQIVSMRRLRIMPVGHETAAAVSDVVS